MPTEPKRDDDAESHGTMHEDEALPSVPDSKVLDETARMAREGRRELESDPKERKGTPE